MLSHLSELKRKQEHGIDVREANKSVAEFLREWLVSVEGTIRPNVFRRYRTVVEVHLVPGLGDYRLTQLTPSRVEAFLRSKATEMRSRLPGKPSAKPLAPRTIQEIRSILSGALSKALKWGYLERNVAALAEGPRVPRSEVQPLTVHQARLFLEAARDHPLEALFVVSLTTGLRQGEALGLRWDDLDLDGCVLHVRRALSRVDGYYVLGDLKTQKSHRSVPLTAMAVTALRAHRQRQASHRESARRWDSSWGDLVFCTDKGRPIYGPNVTRRFQALLAQAGLPRQRYHDLRHAAATLMLSQGVELKVIQEVLGHSTIAVTANTYSHVVDELKRDAVQRIGSLFDGTEEAAGGRT